jgi:hypothetical protein
MTCSVEFGASSWISRDMATGIKVSSRPTITEIGTTILGRIAELLKKVVRR